MSIMADRKEIAVKWFNEKKVRVSFPGKEKMIYLYTSAISRQMVLKPLLDLKK